MLFGVGIGPVAAGDPPPEPPPQADSIEHSVAAQRQDDPRMAFSRGSGQPSPASSARTSDIYLRVRRQSSVAPSVVLTLQSRKDQERRMENESEQDLRDAARKAIENGRVPSRRPERTWGGSGNGARCAVCGKPVRCDELGFEADFTVEGDPLELGSYHMHVRCYHAWEAFIGSGEIVDLIKGLKVGNGDVTIRADERDGQPNRGSG
jgi:hypothetical protein